MGTPFTSAQTIEQLLQHCARSMHSHRSSSDSEGECPQIMILGTHLDEEKRSKETREDSLSSSGSKERETLGSAMADGDRSSTVSYTHLTLPTILLV